VWVTNISKPGGGFGAIPVVKVCGTVYDGQHIIKGGRVGMFEKVQAAINKIRPTLQADGGDVELVSVEGGVVKVRLQGACKGCPMSQMTLRNGIEKFLKKEIPEVVRVEGVA